MKDFIIYPIIIFAFFVFYKIYQYIDPFGMQIGLDLNIRHNRGDLKGSVKAPLMLFIISTAVPAVYLWSKVLYEISLKKIDDIGEYVYVFYPQRILFLMPAMYLGILTSMIIVDFLSKVFLRKHYLDICDFLKVYGGFSSPRSRTLLNVLYSVVCILSIVYLAFFSDFYAVFKDDVIVTDRLGGFKERTYDYSQIERINVSTHKRTSGGNDYRSATVRLVFDDGRKITTSDFGYKYSMPDIQDFIDFVSDKSGKEPVVKKYIWDFK